MATQNLKRKISGLKVGIYLVGITLLMMFFQVEADTAQQAEGGWVPYEPPVLTPVWIQDPYTSESVLTSVPEPDYSLWNKARIGHYEDSLKIESAPPLGILTINKINLQVPIYNGTDDVTLDRGAGRIKGMAKMDEVGNLGISGHRDGFFRGMKDVEVGDDIDIQTTRGTENYEVTSITIIPKEDASVLAPTTEKILTVVTCYPFYFVGHAPKRLIVTAKPKSSLAKGDG
jgi:sortase A